MEQKCDPMLPQKPQDSVANYVTSNALIRKITKDTLTRKNISQSQNVTPM